MALVKEIMITNQSYNNWISGVDSRFVLWERFINSNKIENMAEIGVYRGDYSAYMFAHCPKIKKYYMIDPWRHLDDWNKPLNKNNTFFESAYKDMMKQTEFAAEKRIVLRGKTNEIVESIPDEGLDYAYIDGDHTLRGLTIDLTTIYPKIRNGGWIGGDDFRKIFWEHGKDFEPTFVFPYAVYFAEAVGNRIYALPFGQFLIEKTAGNSFEFIDWTGRYSDTGLKSLYPSEKSKPSTFRKFSRRSLKKISRNLKTFLNLK